MFCKILNTLRNKRALFTLVSWLLIDKQFQIDLSIVEVWLKGGKTPFFHKIGHFDPTILSEKWHQSLFKWV